MENSQGKKGQNPSGVARSFTQEEIDAEPTVTIEVPFSILESAAAEMYFTRDDPSAPENYHSPNARKVLEYLDACVDVLQAEGVLVAEGGFWPTIRQEGRAYKIVDPKGEA
ncbi:hypothetical protein ACFWHR_12215 [Leucobacter sp. NPDC058333]|uniref:hypothetical protein n=1 Tax=Leucobacter sp. NPDC058333 TaxID=3346450 RepID=UPI0036489D9A